jgi:membrane protease YdiL (CAAX protease family)
MMASQFSRSILITLLAIALFSPMFVLKAVGPVDFWWWMTANLVILISLSFFLDKSYLPFLKSDFASSVLRKTGIGLLSAAFLYVVFFVGNYLSRRWFDFAGSGIENVYSFKGDAASIRIALLMLLVIGPGEEIFWRGYLQKQFSAKWGKWTGLIVALIIYIGIHIFTGNFMLIMAALICGLFWGWLYLKYESMLINVISHTVWDIAVFLVLPFNS